MKNPYLLNQIKKYHMKSIFKIITINMVILQQTPLISILILISIPYPSLFLPAFESIDPSTEKILGRHTDQYQKPVRKVQGICSRAHQDIFGNFFSCFMA